MSIPSEKEKYIRPKVMPVYNSFLCATNNMVRRMNNSMGDQPTFDKVKRSGKTTRVS
jgi:hypothetical protein